MRPVSRSGLRAISKRQARYQRRFSSGQQRHEVVAGVASRRGLQARTAVVAFQIFARPRPPSRRAAPGRPTH
jgi:hypothetical protein